MAKKDTQRRIELLEENYFMLKCLKHGSEIADMIGDATGTAQKSLEVVQEQLSFLGSIEDVLETTRELLSDLQDAAVTLKEAYEISLRNIDPDRYYEDKLEEVS